MIEVLSNTYFKYLVVPLVTTFFVIFVKIVSRNDRHNKKFLKKEDFAFGLEMGVTAILLLLGNSVTIAQQTISAPETVSIVNEKLLLVSWIAPVLILGLWGISTMVRRLGWQNDTEQNGTEQNDTKKNDPELKMFWGIIFPDIFGLIILIYVLSIIGF